jgi:hypothetical protein
MGDPSVSVLRCIEAIPEYLFGPLKDEITHLDKLSEEGLALVSIELYAVDVKEGGELCPAPTNGTTV